MKIDRNKLKKCTTEVPADCRVLIDKLKTCSDEELVTILESTTAWTVGKCELYHWVDVLDRFDGILSAAAYTGESEWLLTVNTDEHLQELALAVLHFTSLLIEYSFSRHLYNSVEHLISLLSSSNLDMILSVLNLLYVFSKRSNFLSRLADKQRLPLLKRLGYLAENWGGKENGFGLAESCLDSPVSTFPSNATTLHYEFYADTKTVTESQHTAKKQANNMYCIHVENVHQMSSSPAEIMESLIKMYPVPNDSKMLLYTHLRLAHSFSQHKTRLKCVQARLHAISVLVYTNSVSENIGSILYSGFTEELVDLLQVKDNTLVDIKAAALRTLTSIVHLDCRDRTPRLGAIVDVTGVSQYHGFLPVLVRRCIDSMTSTKNPEFPHSFATALFSFLYHLSSYESGGEALVQSGMMGPLLSVVTNMGDQQEQTTFVTRAVRVIDLITNIDWQAFQAINGLQVFIDRLEHEVAICKKDAPMACDTIPGAAESPSDGKSRTEMETEESGAQCLPQRAALFKSVLNFLKKAISDQAFGGQVRHMMDGTLPNSLKHIIGNVEYYGPALFLLAMEVVTVYVFQEPSLLSSLQDNRLTHVMLHALLVKDPPATREVLASLPNIFSALCINTRGLEAFVNCNPFDRLFHVMLSPDYLLAMRRRRSSDPLGDTASNLGHAMDELMRQQPSLRGATIKAILQLLCELKCLGNDPNIICSRATSSKNEGGGSNAEGTNASSNAPGENGSQADERSEDEVEEVEEVASTSKQSSSSVQMLTAAGGAKKNVPLLDYIQNVTKFIQAIVSNNTGDHCTKFNETGGIAILLHLLRLPSLPLDFPTSAACQSITNLTQTVFILLRAPTVVGESLAHVLDILKNELQPLFLTTPGETRTRPASVLLHELTQQQSADAAENEGSSLVKSLVHLHAFVTLFLTLPRANQNEIRTIIVNQWGSRMGITALEGLNKLYRSLIWESTVLLALCTPGAIPEDSEFGEKELENLLSSAEQGTSKTDSTEASVGMEMEGNEIKSAGSKHKMSPAFSARIKCIKPVLTVASKLGRSLAELFGLLVKLAVGKPIRQRYGRHMAVAHAQNVAPSRPARKLAYSLSTLLLDGLSWRAPPNVPSSKLRTTFLICTVGFTIPMLFDEKKMPYHLMLQYFAGTGSLDALFNCFKWALSSQLDEDNSAEVSSQSNELPGSVDDFLEAWLMLLERLVNPRNILNSPYVIHDKPAATTPTDELAPIVAPFSAVKFLIKTQKAALEALQHLWCSRRLSKLSSRICDSVILILCHLIRGEQIARDKLNEEREEREKKAKANPPTAQDNSTNNRKNQTFQKDLQQLVDMGFAREQVLQALMHASTLEAATEWLLTHSSEDDQLLRAISMSLEGTPAAAASEEPETDAEEEVRDQEDKKKKEEEEQMKVEDEKDDEEPMSASDIDDFAASIFERGLELVNHLPDTVYRVCDVIVVLMKRAGKNWSDGVFNKLVVQIKEKCQKLTDDYKSNGDGVWLQDDEFSDGLAAQALLFALLYEEMKEPCTRVVSHNDLIPTFVALLSCASTWLQDHNDVSTTPKWISPVLLLVDLYERTCITLARKSELQRRFEGHRREWKWFDDRSGRWCSYSASNHKSIDDAYAANLPGIRFTAGRRRYTINFLQLIQFNEESGNRRPIMATYVKDSSLTDKDSNKKSKSEDADTLHSSMRLLLSLKKNKNKKTPETMETDNNGKAAEPVPTSSEESFSGFIRLSPVDADKLVHSCTAFVCLPVDADTLHSSMRLLLRLTRNGIEGGHLRALMFAELGGPAALLRLKFKHGFVGFASLATLLLRHILEEDATLKYSMDKAIHDITVSGAGNASCGVTSGSVGARELHYVLRALAPAACQHPDLFSEACKKNMKIVLPSLTSRNVETEEDNLVSSTGVQIISQSKRTQQAQPSLHLPPVVVETLKLLLDALVATDDFGSEGRKTLIFTKKIKKFVFLAGADQRNSSTSVKLDASTSTSKDNEELNLHQILQSEHSFGEKTQVKSEEGAKKSDHDPKASMEGDFKTQTGKPLVTKSAILRLLAELVKSYPSCAYLLANHQYKANMTPIVTQDCSCLSFILDNLLTPRTEEAVDKDCPALSRVLLACLAACQLQHPSGTSTLPGHDPHVALVSELKSAISRTVHTPESPQKHKRLRALLEIVTTIIECTRTNPQQPRRTLARNQLPEPNVDQSQSVVPRLMVRRGLTTDLAKITHYIDLGSSEMADTVNAALRPLEILTRYTSLYSNKAQQSENKKTTTEEETSQARSEQVQDRQASAEITSPQQWNTYTTADDGRLSFFYFYSDIVLLDGRQILVQQKLGVSDNMSDEYMDVLNPDNVSQESDLHLAAEMQPGHRQDVFMREDEEEIAASRIEQDHDENDGAVDEDERVEDDIADDTINGDESTDSEQDEDDDDDDDDQDDEIEDDGSEMDNQEMDEDEVIEATEFGEDVDYETFVYDFMHGDHQDMDLFIQMEDIFGISRSIPPPPGMIALCHPLLVRHANHAQITDSGGPISIPSNLSTAQQQQLINQQESNHTIHLHYTGGRQPRNAPLVLQRLLGPTVAQDILQVSNSLYTEGGGRAQLIVNTDDANYTPTDIIDVIFLQSGVMANHSASLVPDNVPSSLARWVEESCVLDSQSLYDCITVIKDEIVKHVLDVRDEELSERKEKRKKEKEEKQKEEEQKKKEREEKEKAKKQKKEEVVENTPAEQVTTSSSPSIATPSNTPVATRPDSPSVSSKFIGNLKKLLNQAIFSKYVPKKVNNTNFSNMPLLLSILSQEKDISTLFGFLKQNFFTTERAPAINALQQASSSLLAVSGQLEGLSFSLQQAIGASEDVPATARSASDAQVSGETVSMVAEAAPFSADGATEQLAVPASDRGMDNASPQSDVTMETYEAVAQSAANEMVVSEAEVVTTTTEEGATASSATAPSQVMEGVDPSFLAALPADIRQEVIREQLSRSSHRTVAASSTTGQPSHSGVSPEFLAALPPNIQEEVLEQERRERSRNTAQQAAAGENLDPTTFIQTLPPELRQSVLSDMDESLVAVLSEELAAEAQSLRDDVDERQRRYLQERLLTHGVGLLRQGGVRSRSRHITEGFGGFQRRPGYTESTTRTGQTSTTTTPPLVCRQILDHESLACLLLLLFVDETKLNTNWLHRVLRNLCYHVPSRDWLVATLMSILHRASELHSPKPTTDSEMDVTPSQPTKLQKQMPKKSSISSSADTSFRNTSWMSIKLEAALGSRSSIFQVEGGSSISPSPGSMKKHGRDQGSESSTKRVHIHPQASPVVCRHAIDALIVLSKIFPNYFITQQPSKPKTGWGKSKSNGFPKCKTSPLQHRNKSSMIETDFWDILLRLDASSAHKNLIKTFLDDPHVAGDSASEKSNIDLSITWLGVLMRMLSQPVVKRSQQLTDKMLRLLAQISRYITSEQSQKAKKDTPASGTAPNASVSNTGATTSAEVQVTSADQNSETSGTSTATMGARAGTSNTSTVGRSTAAPQTSTTSSSRSQGSISTISETPATSGAKEDTALQLEKELSLTVGVLTTHACSEEGLEDATTLLLHLSKSAPALRLLIIRLSLEGAQKLGGLLASQIKELLDEIIVYNQQQLASGAIPAVTTAPTKGVIVNRFDSTLTVVLSAKDKFKKLGRELQLPSMQALTSKTSHQAFFLRILKVIIQLQQASKEYQNFNDKSKKVTKFSSAGGSMLSAVQNTVSRLEREADALMDIISPPLPRYRNQTARASQSSSSAAASSSKSETEEEEKKDESTLSERLQLDELWEILGACLKELSKSHDQHAVLVLQPAVEAFFLVHSSETSQSSARRGGGGAETETRESQLAHINEQPPVSPGQPTGSTSESSSSLSSQSSLIDASMPIDTQKFLKFADTHRTVLNQILRQSTVPLSDGPFSVLVDHTRVLDFDVKRRYFRQELERTENSPIRRDDVAIRVQRDHLFEDSFRELHRRTPAELRSRLYVVFDGEDGQDAGGVLREWYLVISREIFNPMYALFRTSPGDHGTYTINPLSYINPNHLSYFKFVGRIVAKAIYDNKLLECYFTRSFYKHILGKPVKYTDMEADDYEFSQGLRYLLEHDITSLGTELFFSVEIEEFGKTEVRDLKENGRNLPVSEKNKREYAHLVCQEKMTGAIKKQLAAFLEGFYEIIPKRLISIFDEQELELLISGLPNVDIDDLRQNTEYHKYQPNSPQIQWFWRALRSFDQAERAKFLQFVTGTSKVPLQGFSTLEGMTGVQKFQIHRDDRSTARLPCAHTCFNQLDLPAYENYDKLRERLLLAITECTEGFGLA
uniref:HECT-type E3 ubiquitin transferase n=1 Tax=Ciona intestinalis TaxID=7719 RepID=F6XN27_CIOIN